MGNGSVGGEHCHKNSWLCTRIRAKLLKERKFSYGSNDRTERFGLTILMHTQLSRRLVTAFQIKKHVTLYTKSILTNILDNIHTHHHLISDNRYNPISHLFASSISVKDQCIKRRIGKTNPSLPRPLYPSVVIFPLLPIQHRQSLAIRAYPPLGFLNAFHF